MSGLECTECGQPVLEDFDVCPNCGAELPFEQAGATAPAEPEQPRQSGDTGRGVESDSEQTEDAASAGDPLVESTEPTPGEGAAGGDTVQSPGSAQSRDRTEPQYDGWPQGRRTALLGAVAGAVGAFLPWATTEGLSLSGGVSGFEAEGALTLGVAVVVGAVALWRWAPVQRAVAALLGVPVMALAFLYMTEPTLLGMVLGADPQVPGTAGPGVGLYATAFGGLAALLGAVSDTWLDTDWKRA